MKITAIRISHTLLDRLIASENERHVRRLKEIQRMASKLQRFEPTFNALCARGIHLSLDQMYLNYRGQLSVTAGITSSDGPLYSALLELGFKQKIEALNEPSYAVVALTKQRLTVSVMIRPYCLRTDTASAGKPNQTSAPTLVAALAAAGSH